MAIAFVQYDYTWADANAGSVAAPAQNMTTGNTAIVCTGSYSNTAGAQIVYSVTDTASNTYTKAIGRTSSNAASGMRSEIWYCQNMTGNANNIITVTFTGDSLNRFISASEYSGIGASPLLDTSGQDSKGETSHTSGEATSDNTGDLIVGMYHSNNDEDMTVGSGFTALTGDLTRERELAEYKVLGAAGNYAATLTTGTTSYAVTTCAIFSSLAATGTNTQINIGDVWKEIAAVQINIGDEWKEVTGMQINIGDDWKTIS